MIIMGILSKLFAAASEPQRVMSLPTPRGAVRRDDTSIMQQRGWERSGKTYTGPFATAYGTWHGCITDAGDIFRCSIKDPPMNVISNHPKYACFSRDVNEGWWRINLAVSPVDHDVNAIILYVERVLTESHRRKEKM